MNRRVPSTPAMRPVRAVRPRAAGQSMPLATVQPIRSPRTGQANRPLRSRAASAPRDAAFGARLVGSARGFWGRVFSAQSPEFYRLAGITGLLAGIGLVMVLSSSSIASLKSNGDPFYVFGRQLMFALIGVFLMMLVSLIHSDFFLRWWKPIVFSAATLQFAATIPGIGTSVNGNRNWLKLPLIGTVQPSEFLKLAIIIVVSVYMMNTIAFIHDHKAFTWASLTIGLMGVILVMLGSDLGTSVIIVMIVLGMVWLAGAPQAAFRLPVALLALGVGVFGLTGSRLARITAWLGPMDDDSSPYTWQTLHGIWALAAGRVTGAGLGQSRLKWSWIPEVENDYIFAIIGEEFGFIGALVVIALFLFLIFSISSVLLRTNGLFQRFLVSGVLIWIGFQALVNIAVVLRLLPVLGVPLPLISAGGSSLISSLIAIGIVLSVERQNHMQSGMRSVAPAAARLRSRGLR